jgi:hypothetical protein
MYSKNTSKFTSIYYRDDGMHDALIQVKEC